MAWPELGREFGGRDHSTVQHGCRKVKRAYEDQRDPDLSTKIRLIEQTLNTRS